MRDLDLSLPVDSPGRAFHKNGYSFGRTNYAQQVLLRFKPNNGVALRVTTYGRGHVAHFGWSPRFGDDKIGRRNWELFHRVVLWAAGRVNKDLRPEPVFFQERYGQAMPRPPTHEH